jgi:hypothetical protein
MRAIFPILLVLFVLSCSRTPESLTGDEYAKWISAEENGLVKVKSVKNINITARYLPAPYLAYREYMLSDSIAYDSILKAYQCGLSFQVTVQADKSDRMYNNLLQAGVYTEQDFKERIRYLSFSIGDFISLKHNDINYLPVLSNYEGFDAMGNRMSFQVVFIIPEYNCAKGEKDFRDVVLTFDDPYWSTGKNNFEFSKSGILGVPGLKF